MDGDVKEHKVIKGGASRKPVQARENYSLPAHKTKSAKKFSYQTQIIKRSVARILNTVQHKLKRLISDVTNHSPEEIQRALSNPEAEKVLKNYIRKGSIQLVDQQSQSPVYKRQMSKIGESGYRAAAESPGASDDEQSCHIEPEDAELVSLISDS